MPVTQEELKAALDYAPETGVFTWRVRPAMCVRVGDVAGADKASGYRTICVRGVVYMAHRLAWLYVHGEWPRNEIDHINGDPSDNRIANLRDVSRTENQENQRRAQRHNKVGLLGVSPNGSGFISRIKVAGRKLNLGTFPTPELAHAVYIKAKRYLHAGCTL